MSRHWPPTRGDNKGQLERFTLTGITASYSDRGMFYVSITASAINVYKDVDRAVGDLVATGSHSTPTSWTKITLSQNGSSGVSGSVYLLYQEADATIEVWPTFNTDTELGVAAVSISSYPKSSGTTFLDQHAKTMEDFVRLLRQRIPPQPGSLRASGTRRLDTAGPWRVNSVGDYECVRLQNLIDYREWALHRTLELIYRSPKLKLLGDETQLSLINEEAEMASAAWAAVLPLVDADLDLDADREVKRFRLGRG